MTPGREGSCLLIDGHNQAGKIKNTDNLDHLGGRDICSLDFPSLGCGQCSARATLTAWRNALDITIVAMITIATTIIIVTTNMIVVTMIIIVFVFEGHDWRHQMHDSRL